MRSKEFWVDLLERAIATFAEAMLGFLTFGVAIDDINWSQAVSVSIVATMISVCKCFIKIKPAGGDDETE
jgi:hypothetical protein